MSTQDKFETIHGYTSTVKNGDEFDYVQLRFGRSVAKNMDNGTTTKRLPEEYKEKFGSLKRICNTVPDEVLDYTIILDNNGLYFRGITESTVRFAFALFAREHMTDKKVMMLTEKAYTFRIRDVPKEENADVMYPGCIFPDDGDY